MNEAAEYDEGSRPGDAPRQTAAIRSVGPAAYVREMCLQARKADPDATIVVNEATHALRRLPKMERMFQELDSEPRVYDVIGMQFHQGKRPIPIEQVWAAVNRLAKYCERIQITEVTIAAENADEESKQVEAAETFYRAMFSHPNVEAIVWWNLTDRGAFQAGGGLLRKDLSPKPAYTMLRKLIREEWWTRPVDVRVAAGGCARLEGFYGDYEVSATRDGGPRLTGALEHRANRPAQTISFLRAGAAGPGKAGTP